MMDEVLQLCKNWMNERISLFAVRTCPVGTHDLYRYVAVLLFSHLTGFSFAMNIRLLEELGSTPPSLDRLRFISQNVLAYSATSRGDMHESSWSAQRDQTQELSNFERAAFRMTAKIFLTPMHTFLTLDDDLYGTRAKDNQVKTLSKRKADREGHTADTIADALFRVTLMVRFRRRGESQTNSVSKLFAALMEGRGEQSMHGLVVTADRGYGSLSLVRSLLRHGIGSTMIMPNHILRCHPFVGKSYFNINRYDDEEGSSDPDPGDDCESDESVDADADVPSGTAVERVESCQMSQARHLRFDRRKAFVIDDSPDCGPGSFFAVKSVKPAGTPSSETHTSRRAEVNAVAVREKGTNKFSNVIRFMYTVPSSMAESIETWVAVPKTYPTTHLLFSRRDDNARIFVPPAGTSTEKDALECYIMDNCSVLTVGQRCADWFVMRQFRVTGTSAGQIVLSDIDVRNCIGLPLQANVPERTVVETVNSFLATWFSSTRSIEAMMRGSANESAVLTALSGKDFFVSVFECGMLAKANRSWLACSPDGIAIIEKTNLGLSDSTESEDCSADNTDRSFTYASVEIKTCVAESSLDKAIGRASMDVITCTVGDAKFREYITQEHMGQVLQQMLVLSLNHSIYVSASEVGIMYVVVVQCPDSTLSICEQALYRKAQTAVAWAHDENPELPTFITSESRQTIENRLPFWMTVNNWVKENGAFPRLKLFKHGAQSLYSKTKGGVDGSAQARAILRSSTSSLPWEQKLVSQTIKKLAVNAFVSWRMSEKEELLSYKEAFGSLDLYRDALNNVGSLADFISDISKELLVHADQLQNANDGDREEQNEDTALDDVETARLLTKAKCRRGKRLLFFNSPDGVKLRLVTKHHPQKMVPGKSVWCSLCGTSSSGPRMHRSSFKCSTCDIHLCIRTYPGQRKSWYTTWHEARRLTERNRATDAHVPQASDASPTIPDTRTNRPSASGHNASIPTGRPRTRRRIN